MHMKLKAKWSWALRVYLTSDTWSVNQRPKKWFSYGRRTRYLHQSCINSAAGITHPGGITNYWLEAWLNSTSSPFTCLLLISAPKNTFLTSYIRSRNTILLRGLFYKQSYFLSSVEDIYFKGFVRPLTTFKLTFDIPLAHVDVTLTQIIEELFLHKDAQVAVWCGSLPCVETKKLRQQQKQ